MINLGQTTRAGFRNLFLAVGMFLPLFLLGIGAEVKLRGAASFEEGFVYHLSAAIVVYFSLVLPVILGSIIHTAALALLSPRISIKWRRIATVALAPIVPLLIIFLDLSGALLLVHFYAVTITATAAYGLACAILTLQDKKAREN